MNARLGPAKGSRMGAVLLSLVSLFAPRPASAQSICAVAKIELGQEAALEREGFTATLKMTNNLADQPLTGLRIELIIKDENGAAADSLFFANVTSLEGAAAIDGTGTVQPSGTASTRWLIIPSPGAGGTGAAGVRYTVQARMSMLTSGVPRVITTFPVAITVKPQPLLKLEYVLPFEVFGDEPFTEVHESTVPFPLGLRVSNIGAGTAKKFKVTSNQPLITDNQQGLAVDFNLLGTWLGADVQPENTLLLPFGDIAPATSKQAAWSMTSTLSGRFVDFTASFTHAAELGGALTSLIESVTTYTLIKDVVVDLPGRDAQFDFLINATTPRSTFEANFALGRGPVPEFLMESDRPGLTPVVDVPAQLTGSLSGAGSVLQLTFLAPVASNTWVHAEVPAPNAGTAPLLSVTRADGKVVSPRNAWISRHFDKTALAYSHHLHVLDYTGTEPSSYAMAFNAATLDTPPSAIADLSAAVSGEGTLDLTWTATGEDGGAGTIFGGRYAVFATTDPLVGPTAQAALVSFATSTTPGATHQFRLSGLAGNATYYVNIYLADAGGQYSPASNRAAARTGAFGPQSLAAVSSETALDFSWLTGANAAGAAYRLVLSSAGGTVADTGYVVDASSASFISLTANTTYVLSAQARNAALFESPAAVAATQVTRAFAPLALPFTDVGESSATANWAANGNPDGTQYRVELSTLAGGPAVADSGWVGATSNVFSGLLSGALYQGRVRARSHAGVETAAADLGAMTTVAVDTTTPSLSLVPPDGSTVTTATPALIAAYFDAESGISTSTVRLFLDESEVTGQAAVSASSASFVPAAALSQGTHTASAQVFDRAGNVSSMTAAFFVDSIAPATQLLVNGLATGATELVLISTDTLGFLASDDGTGAARTLYALDGTTVPVVFTSTFTLSAGTYTLAFHSVDQAGNAEIPATIALDVRPEDQTPPTLSLAPPDGGTAATARPSIVAAYSDSGAIASVRLTLDGEDVTAQAAVTASSAVFVSAADMSQGTHTATAQVSDSAGNVSTAAATFLVDSVAPVTTLLVNGQTAGGASLVVTSTDSVGFTATDGGSGVLEILYALDGSTSSLVFSSTFSLAAGTHTLAFGGRDRAGNQETLQITALTVLGEDLAPPSLALTPTSGSTVTTASPQVAAAYADSGRGIDSASVRLSLDGVDVTTLSFVTASSAAFVPNYALAQGTHTFTASVSDLVGNSASDTSAFLVDSLPPLTGLLVNGLPAGSTVLVLISTDTVGFTATDAGTGVLETLYSVDGGAEAVFASTFTLSPGSLSLAFHSRDGAGNLEAAQTVSITVTSPIYDTTPPLVRLDFPGTAALGVEQAVGGVVDVRGAASDASALTWTLEAAPGAGATGGFTTIASGAGNLSGIISAWNTTSLSGYQTLRLRATDAFGNAAEATADVFVGGPVFTFAVGRKDSNVIVNKIRNPTGIAVRSDGLIWVASTDKDELVLLTSSGGVVAVIEEGIRDFKNPQGLALDADNNLYVADKGNDRVVKLSPDGSQLLLQIAKLGNNGKPKPGSGPGELRKPWDVAVDGNGDIYVADSGNRRIQVFNSSGNFLRQFGPGVLLSTSEVRGIALTGAGLWVSDKELRVIHLFSRAGVLIKTIGDADSVVGEISRMRGLAADRQGALYVVEPNRDRTQKFDAQGKGLLAFGSKAGLSQADKHAKLYLTMPIDAAVAPDGSIWITDTGRDRIVRYALPVSGGYAVAAYAGGGAGSSSSVEPAKRVVDAQDGARVERDDGAGVSVPKGALTADLEITVEKGDENQDKEQKTAKRRDMKIAAVSEEVQYGPEGTTFNAPVTLILPYDADLIASQGVKEDELKVYYWNPTLKDWQVMPSTVDKLNKTVNAQTTHFSAYQVGGLGGIGVAAIDDFGYRDAYTFPNPSRNGSAVTFRMQPGSADSIEVRVYDLSGRKVHSSSDFRFLGALDDGNGKGAQNTYDHIWNVSGIGSGVYTFVMTAKKAGQTDIRKTGKVGVIR